MSAAATDTGRCSICGMSRSRCVRILETEEEHVARGADRKRRRTIHVRRHIGETAVVVTRTKLGHILICETDYNGESKITTERQFDAIEHRVKLLRQMIDQARAAALTPNDSETRP